MGDRDRTAQQQPRAGLRPDVERLLAVVVAVAAGLALVVLLLLDPAVPALAARDARGAKAMRPGAKLQTRADAVRPSPRNASKDRSRAYSDGCLAEERDTRSRRCAYGRRGAKRTVVLFGDSHAMHWFPAVRKIAARRGWRLVNLTKAGCPVPRATVHNRLLRRAYPECDAWRRHALRRIERGRPDLVVASSGTYYRVYDGGRRLGAAASGERLLAGWIETLRRLRATGADVVAIEDTPRPGRAVPPCVARWLKKLRRCAFERRAGLAFPHYATRATEAVDGVRLVDATPKLCFRRLCPVVIGDVLVYRNGGHITGTYAGTMWRWLNRRLPALR